MTLLERFNEYVTAGNVLKAYSVGHAAIVQCELRSEAARPGGVRRGKQKQAEAKRRHRQVMLEAEKLYYQCKERHQLARIISERVGLSKRQVQRILTQQWGAYPADPSRVD